MQRKKTMAAAGGMLRRLAPAEVVKPSIGSDEHRRR
jgi:hypothetical protein